MARQVGTKRVDPYEIGIARPKGTELCPDGVRRNGVSAPFIGKSIAEDYHPGGNSLCYTIQTAYHMGSQEIYCLGFTLKSGSRYFFGQKNPVTKRTSIYDERRALDWLAWFESQWPGRAKLVEGWDGPAYDVLQTVTCDDLLDQPKRSEEWLL